MSCDQSGVSSYLSFSLEPTGLEGIANAEPRSELSPSKGQGRLPLPASFALCSCLCDLREEAGGKHGGRGATRWNQTLAIWQGPSFHF